MQVHIKMVKYIFKWGCVLTEDSLLIWLQNIPTLVFYVQVIQMSHR